MNKRQALFADTPTTRRKVMSSIRSKDTGPERTLRSALHGLGYRFRKNLAGLPGRPDVAFTRRRKAVFVHGCFWHQHGACKDGHLPKNRHQYWVPKFERIRERDQQVLSRLQESGWQSLVLWECELRGDPDGVLTKLGAFLGPPQVPGTPAGRVA